MSERIDDGYFEDTGPDQRYIALGRRDLIVGRPLVMPVQQPPTQPATQQAAQTTKGLLMWLGWFAALSAIPLFLVLVLKATKSAGASSGVLLLLALLLGWIFRRKIPWRGPTPIPEQVCKDTLDMAVRPGNERGAS